VLATAALAAAVQAAEDKTATLEEIVVTAERRSESLQDTPLSITAFSDTKRDIVGIQSIQDMANFAPGLSYNMATDRPSIRGIARQSNFFTIDSPVANYFDGVYTSSVQDAQRRPIFIERTEVLRGPQGALSGRGSIAGAINTISKHPKDDFEGEVRAFGGNYSRYGGEGTLTGPIKDWWRVRVNIGSYHQNEGYFQNTATHHGEGDQPNNRTIQDYLMDFDIGSKITFFVKASFADYDESRRTGYTSAPYVAGVLNNPTAYGPSSGTLTPLASFGYFPGGAAVRLGGEAQNPVITTGDVHKFSNDYPSRQVLDGHHSFLGDLIWHGDAFDFRWIAGQQQYKYTQWTDQDGTDVLTMKLPTGRVIAPGGTLKYMEERNWYSNEINLTSKGDGAFSWILGLYQSNEDFNQEPATTTFPGYNELNAPFGTVDTLLRALGLPACSATITAGCYNPGGIRTVVANPRPNTSVVGLIDGNTISSAAFGQVDYKLNDAWKFTVGVRYNQDDKTATEQLRYIANSLGNSLGNFLAGGALGRPLSVDVTPVPVAGAPLPAGVINDRGIDPVSGYRIRDMKNSWSATTGSVGVDYKPAADDLIYLRVAKGYRPGGFNAGFLYDPPMVDQESVISYEIGYKTTFFNKLQLSASAFYYDYKDIQLPLPTLGRCTDANDLSTCTILNSFINLPTARNQGIELEANWQATDELNLYFSYGYLDAKIKNALAPGSQGFQNPDDPAAVLGSANRYRPILVKSATPCPPTPGPLGCSGGFALTNSIDSDYTFLPRYTQDLSGHSLANSPKNKAALNANYTLQSAGGGKLIVSANAVWRDTQFSDVFETKESEVPSFTTYGLRLLWTDADNHYTFILYGSNLTDAEAPDAAGTARLRTGLATAAAPSVAGAAYFKTINLAPPREFGLEVQYRFGK
jgi:iron complex outermembrane receptor protein